MTSKKRKLVYLLVLVLFLFASCNSNQEKDPKEQSFMDFVGLKEADDINDGITLAVSFYTQDPYYFGQELWVDINVWSKALPLYTTNEVFAFYVYDSDLNEWKELENPVEYQMDNLRYEAQSKIDPFPLLSVGRPKLENGEEEYDFVRVLFCVERIEDDIPTGKKVAAFIDVKIGR